MHDDVLRDLLVAELLGPAGEELFCILLLERLAGAVGLLCVTDVGQRDLAAQLTQDPAQRERVPVVVRAVVGNDDLGHLPLLCVGDLTGSKFAAMVAEPCH